MDVTRELTRDDIGETWRDRVGTQAYSARRVIDGVRVLDLRRSVDDGGSFSELFRMASGHVNGLEGFEVVQANYSDLEPGAIKAWHLHFRQEDLWFVPPSNRILAGLIDMRRASATAGVTMRLTLGEGRAQLVFIPRGVAHGLANPTSARQSLLYFVNNTFSPEAPDEHRLDPFLLGREFWQIQAG